MGDRFECTIYRIVQFDPLDVRLCGCDRPWYVDTCSFVNLAAAPWILSLGLHCAGFAFAHDLYRLRPLMRTSERGDSEDDVARHELGSAELLFVDIQKVAMASAHGNGVSSATGRAHTPGLASVAQRWLQKTLDKGEQCSDWDARPLSEQQLHYAACDAAVLVDIAGAMGLSSACQHSQTAQLGTRT